MIDSPITSNLLLSSAKHLEGKLALVWCQVIFLMQGNASIRVIIHPTKFRVQSEINALPDPRSRLQILRG
jgi:hypothetical protein